MIKAIYFDMNETLLDLSSLQIQFDKYFDSEFVLKYWFTKLLHSSCVMGAVESYRDFGELSEVALESLFFESNKVLTPSAKKEILGEFRKLPAYIDVLPSLELLRENNIRIVAISNSSLTMIKEQLSNAGIIGFFDSYYSVDQVEKYKPFKNIYHSVCKDEGLTVDEVIMVATHDWDLFGAKSAGLKTAYIERKRQLYNPLYFKADFVSNKMDELIKKILTNN